MKWTTRTGSLMLRLSIIIFFSLLTASCATGKHGDQKIRQLLKESVDQFNEDMRWQVYEQAQAFVPKAQREHYWAEADRLKHDIRLTEYEVRDISFSEDERSAAVILHYQYWSVESPTLRSVTITQTWFYDEHTKAWKVKKTGFKSIAEPSSGF